MEYWEERRVKSWLAKELYALGWLVFGYKPDESKMQFDHHSPPEWDGVAILPGCPDYTLGVKVGSWGPGLSGNDILEESKHKILVPEGVEFPTHHPRVQQTPKRKFAHLEHEGVILASWQGASEMQSGNYEHQQDLVAKYARKLHDRALQAMANHNPQFELPIEDEVAPVKTKAVDREEFPDVWGVRNQ